MGYYTQYSLTVSTKDKVCLDELSHQVYKAIEAILTPILGESDTKDLLDGYTIETKWYDHEQDMKELAKKIPQLIFELEGRGEETSDWWREFYYGDKFVRNKCIAPAGPPQEFFES